MTDRIDFSTVTESPGNQVSREALVMMGARYGLTARHAVGRRYLEVACGAGQGLGPLARVASTVVGADITLSLVETAQRAYGGRIPVLQADALQLPFADGAFDVVSIHESLYYFDDITRALLEARRVLSDGGTLVISSVNPEWSDFNPSPFARRYPSASELDQLLLTYFHEASVTLGFSTRDQSLRGRVMSFLKRTAVKLGLIPRTMKGKELLKRFAFGSLVVVSAELEASTLHVPASHPYASAGDRSSYKVIYATAHRGRGETNI